MSSNLYAEDISGENKLRKCFNQFKNVKCAARYANRKGNRPKVAPKKAQDWMSQLVDFQTPELFSHVIEEIEMDIKRSFFDPSNTLKISDPNNWKCYTVKNIPKGLIVIPGVFDKTASQFWFDHLHNVVPFEFAKDLRANIELPPSPDSLVLPFKNPDEEYDANEKNVMLRWVSFGYWYDWNTKKYSETKSEIPPSIVDLLTQLTDILGFEFNPEAGVVNYYSCKSRLSAHQDQSEGNLKIPLVSISFGGDAVLIVGGTDKDDDNVYPLLIRNGDVVIMSQESRLIWHSVPKVFCRDHHDNCDNGRRISRINLNVRQVN